MDQIIIPVALDATPEKTAAASLVTSIPWRDVIPFIHTQIRIKAHESIVGLIITDKGIEVRLKLQ